MITPMWVLLGAVLPAVIGLALPLAASCRCWPLWVSRIVSAIAIALGFEAGFLATYGWPKFPPVEAHEWLMVVLRPAALAIAILATTTRIPAKGIWLLRFIIAFGAALILLQPYIKYTWSGTQSTVWLLGLGVGAALLWWLVFRLVVNNHATVEEDHTPANWLSWALAFVSGGTGITILMSGSQTLGQLGITLGAVLLGVAVASLIARKQAFLVTSHLDLTVTLLIGIWLGGYFYAQLSATHALLLALAPLTAWVGNLSPHRENTLRKILFRLALVVILVIGVVGSAAVKFAQEATDDGYGYHQIPSDASLTLRSTTPPTYILIFRPLKAEVDLGGGPTLGCA